MFLFAWWVKKSLMWETIWCFKCVLLGIADVYSGCGVPLHRPLELFTLSLSRTMSRYTSLQCSINTILADHKSLPYLLLTILSDSSLWRISTQLKFSGKPMIPIIDLVDKSKSFGSAYSISWTNIQIISTWCYNWNSLKIWYITKTVIPCSLQSIATLQNTILIARYVQEKYSGDLSCASANKKMPH